jgi:hypothetical protein
LTAHGAPLELEIRIRDFVTDMTLLRSFDWKDVTVLQGEELY